MPKADSMHSTPKTPTTRRGFLSSATSIAAGGALALTILPALAVDDPVFALIEKHKALEAALEATLCEQGRIEAMGEEFDDSLVDAAHAAEKSALGDLIETVPPTLAGVTASMTYIAGLSYLQHGRLGDEIGPLLGNLAEALEGLVAGLPVAAASPKIASASPSIHTDPVFEAIKLHRQLDEEHLAKLDLRDDILLAHGEGDPRWQLLDRQVSDVSSAFDDAAYAFLEIEPTTVAGANALLSYFAEVETERPQYFPDYESSESEQGDDDCVPFGVALVRHVSEAIGRITRSTSV
jgi:hypothetical protein